MKIKLIKIMIMTSGLILIIVAWINMMEYDNIDKGST